MLSTLAMAVAPSQLIESPPPSRRKATNSFWFLIPIIRSNLKLESTAMIAIQI